MKISISKNKYNLFFITIAIIVTCLALSYASMMAWRTFMAKKIEKSNNYYFQDNKFENSKSRPTSFMNGNVVSVDVRNIHIRNNEQEIKNFPLVDNVFIYKLNVNKVELSTLSEVKIGDNVKVEFDNNDFNVITIGVVK